MNTLPRWLLFVAAMLLLFGAAMRWLSSVSLGLMRLCANNQPNTPNAYKANS